VSRKRKRVVAPSSEIAILSDIHSNLHALQAVLAECARRKITRFFCLGDIVGYAAFPGECVKQIRALRCPTVIGNHDYYAAGGDDHNGLSEGARLGIEYSKKKLTAAARKWLRALPEVIDGESCTLVHSSLDEPLEWNYIFDPDEARPSLVRQEKPVCFYGHTHVPKLFSGGAPSPVPLAPGKFQLQREGYALINCGSVGQPRNENPLAQFGIFNPAEFTVELASVEYDMEGAAKAILEAGLPEYLAERLLVGM
jgi:diadenosine tetraphosphatase ApaH/serine/threonine PP2A family protein phosphatase